MVKGRSVSAKRKVPAPSLQLSKRAKLLLVTVLAILIVLALVAVQFQPATKKNNNTNGNNSDDLPPTTGDWIINKTVVVEKKSLVVKGNLTVLEKGRLNLRNSTLKIGSTALDAIVIRPGGELQVNHTLIDFELQPTAYRLKAMTGSKLEMMDSQIPFEVMLNASGADLENNVIKGKYAGLSVGSSDNKILNNTITGSDYPVLEAAIFLDNGTHNTISKNILSGYSKNLYLSGSNNNTIYDNLMSSSSSSGAGIQFSRSNDNTVTYNEIRGCAVGIDLVGSSSNTFHHNNLISNKKQAQDDRTNKFDDGTDGNYWSDYKGIDLNKDGKGDIPYFINLNDRDNHPFMAPVKRP
jgi:parallel beta-helix repeat protein